jgi:hypothetical protein
MSSKGLTKSAASIRVKSIVRVRMISPAKAKSVGILISKKEAIELARNLLVLASSDDIQGDIVVTGHPQKGLVTILGYKNWRRDAESRDLDAEQLIRTAAAGEEP